VNQSILLKIKLSIYFIKKFISPRKE